MTLEITVGPELVLVSVYLAVRNKFGNCLESGSAPICSQRFWTRMEGVLLPNSGVDTKSWVKYQCL
jgi:hypothetical protein